MKKIFFITLIAIIGVLCSCKKNNSNAPKPTQQDTTTYSPYYFKFNYQDTTHKYTNSKLGLTTSPNAIFCHQLYHDTGNYPYADFSLQWASRDTIHESDIMALQGMTINFNTTVGIFPSFTYEKAANNALGYTSLCDNSYNMNFTSVNFLKNDTVFGYPVKEYVIDGTCKILVGGYHDSLSDMTGSFHLIFTHINY